MGTVADLAAPGNAGVLSGGRLLERRFMEVCQAHWTRVRRVAARSIATTDRAGATAPCSVDIVRARGR